MSAWGTPSDKDKQVHGEALVRREWNVSGREILYMPLKRRIADPGLFFVLFKIRLSNMIDPDFKTLQPCWKDIKPNHIGVKYSLIVYLFLTLLGRWSSLAEKFSLLPPPLGHTYLSLSFVTESMFILDYKEQILDKIHPYPKSWTSLWSLTFILTES